MARQVLPIVGAVVGAFIAPGVGASWGYAIGTIVGNIVDPQVIKGPKIGEAGTQTSAEGVPRPVIFGTAPVVGNVIMRGNRQIKKKRDGGKGGPVTETERVYWTFAIRIGEPIQNVLRIWEDEKLVYDILPTSQIEEESADFAKKFRLYYGTEDQLPDPDLEVIKGVGNVCAHHGTSYIVFPNYDLTDRRESIPTYRFEVASSATSSLIPGALAIGRNTNDTGMRRLIQSADGAAWSAVIVPDSGVGFANRLTPVAGARFLGFSAGAASARYTDDFGATWTVVTLPLTPSEPTGTTYIDGVAMVTANGGICRTTDFGVTFAAVNTGENYRAIAGDESLIVALTDETKPSFSSDGGVTWSAPASRLDTVLSPPFSFQYCGASGGGRFIFGGSTVTGTPCVCITDDGVNFDVVTLPGSGTQYVNRLAYGGGRWVAGYNDGTFYYSTTGGLTWIAATDSLGVPCEAIVWNGSIFIAGGGNSGSTAIKTSTDGNAWVARTQLLSEQIFDIQVQPHGGQISEGQPVPLYDIVSALHGRVKQPASKYDVTELVDMVDGVVFAGDYTVADGIRSVLTPYFSDASEYDDSSGWKLHYIKRGKAVIKTLIEADLVDDPEESTRESAIEFPAKLHMFFQNPLIGYAPAKATSTRSSPDIRVVGEASVQVPVVIDDVDEAAQIANKLHKVSWAEAGGDVKFTITDEHLDLVASDCIGLSLRGTVRRLRVTQIEDNPGTRGLTCRIDRQSAYTSNLTGVPLPPPTPPPPSLVGPSLFVDGDWPALQDTDDVLGYYVGAGGTTDAWYGAVVQRQDSIGDFEDIASFGSGSVIGVLQAGVADASEDYTDTTNSLAVHFAIDPELGSLTDVQFLSEAGGLAVENPDGTWELMQYRDAVQDSAGDYILTTLHRGRLNSGTSAHTSGGRVVLLSTVKLVSAVTAMIDTDLTHRAVSYGLSPESAIEYTQTYTALSQTEFPCASLTIAHNLDSVDCSTIPRHRFGTDDNPIRSINWTGYYWTATDGVNNATVEGAPAAASFNVTGWSSPITVTVAQVNRYTGAGPAITEVIE